MTTFSISRNIVMHDEWKFNEPPSAIISEARQRLVAILFPEARSRWHWFPANIAISVSSEEVHDNHFRIVRLTLVADIQDDQLAAAVMCRSDAMEIIEKICQLALYRSYAHQSADFCIDQCDH